MLLYLYSSLKTLSYKIQIDKFQIVDAVKAVIQELRSIWEESSIKLKRTDHCYEKLRKLYTSYTNIKKFTNRSKKVIDFVSQLSNVFDVSQDDSIKILNSLDDKVKNEFLSKPVAYIKNKVSMLNCVEMPGKCCIYNLTIFNFFFIIACNCE